MRGLSDTSVVKKKTQKKSNGIRTEKKTGKHKDNVMRKGKGKALNTNAQGLKIVRKID